MSLFSGSAAEPAGITPGRALQSPSFTLMFISSLFRRTTGRLRHVVGAHVSDILTKIDDPGRWARNLVRQFPRICACSLCRMFRQEVQCRTQSRASTRRGSRRESKRAICADSISARPRNCFRAAKPWHAGDQRRPDRGRPQHVAAVGKLLIPGLDNALRLGARGIVGNLPVGNYGNIESPRPHAHRGSIAESMRLIKWRNARSVGIRANHEGACRAFSTTLHIGVFARRRRNYWRRSLTTRWRRPQPSKLLRSTNG